MKKKLLLFDVDGTLALSMQEVSPKMRESLLDAYSKDYVIASVGGSNIEKVKNQLGDSINMFKYMFAENGTVAFKWKKEFQSNSIQKWLGNETLTEFNNFTLHLIADLDIPVKTGTFIELRRGMINVCPVGRNCSQEEREEFANLDAKYGYREKMAQALRNQFSNKGLAVAIGGQISLDVFPKGWDKTYCLQFLKEYDEIYFFGDKTMPGGNDHEISNDPRITKSYTVTCPDDTIRILQENFL